ncbi:MAG: hypothetical protein WCP79_06515 [Bacillota bacterium]
MEDNNVGYIYYSLIICSLITAMAASFIFFGIIPAALVCVSGIAALVLWYFCRTQSERINDRILPWYLLTTIALLLKNIEELLFGYPAAFVHAVPSLIPDVAIFDNQHYFAVYSCLLTAIFMLGAVGIVRKNRLGDYLTYFVFVWAILDGALHFLLPLFFGTFSYFPGQLFALISLVIAAGGLRTLLSGHSAPKPPAVPVWRAPRRKFIPVVLIFIACFATAMYDQAGLRPTLIVCGSMLGGMVIWIKTTFKKPLYSRELMLAYLWTLAIFFFHITEEYLTNFPGRIDGIFNTQWTLDQFAVLIVFVGPVFWILGAVLYYYHHPLGDYLVWFIFFGMIVGEPTHYLVFPLLEGGRFHYFPAMWTALFPMIPAIYGAALLIKGYRKQR